jgi:2-polyprenyl-6-methoxyphenol hydroxylase-like FAD-dependent oxidoreductase
LDYEVVIVGGGPVGLTAASLLGRRGHRVALVERFEEIYPLPRAVRLDGEIMRTFQAVGIVDEIAATLMPIDSYRWLGADGEVILDIEWGGMAPSGWAANYSFWQPAVDGALDRRARSWPSVEVLRGWAAEELEQDDEGCLVRIRRSSEADGDETMSLRSRFVIGADGANSFVRQALGIEQVDFGFAEHWLVVDARPDDLSPWPRGAGEQRCDPDRPTTIGPNGSSARRWEFMLLPGEDPAEFADRERVWELLEPYLARDAGELIRSAVYQFRSLVATQMRHGRAFLAGDAAHVMPPFMGEGMCSGIRDAANLSWRLDLVLCGIGDERLLDDYETERGPHNEAMIDVSIKMGRVSCTTDPAAAAERDRAFRAGDVPPPPPPSRLQGGTLAAADRVAGILTPQGTMKGPDGKIGKLDDLVGVGFALVCGAGDPRRELAPDLLRFLDSIGTAIVSLDLDATSPYLDCDGAITGFLEANGIVAFISRPDGYGYGSASGRGDLPGLIKRLMEAIDR